MKMNTKLDKGDWVDYEDMRFLIRPFPASEMLVIPNEKEKEKEYRNQTMRVFIYCIAAWEGLEDEKTGKPIPCNAKMKQYIFDHVPKMRDFIAKIISKQQTGEVEEAKN